MFYSYILNKLSVLQHITQKLTQPDFTKVAAQSTEGQLPTFPMPVSVSMESIVSRRSKADICHQNAPKLAIIRYERQAEQLAKTTHSTVDSFGLCYHHQVI